MAASERAAKREKLIRKIHECFDKGMSSAEIAAFCKAPRGYVYNICVKSGRSFQARIQRDVAARRNLVIASWLDGLPVREIAIKHKVCRQCVYDMIERQRQLDAAEVPAWVPVVFHDQYRSIAYDRGEPDAAAWARSAKKMAA